MTDLERYILRYGGMCRDCADSDGTCPSSGIPCDTEVRLKVIRRTIEAIDYGVRHGFIQNPFSSAKKEKT